MKNKQLWNITQNFRAALSLKPMNCWCKPEQAYSCVPGQTFLCDVCGKEQPYCRGADDAYFDICDYCYSVANAAHEAANHSLENWADSFEI
jgi:hypothetical protein